MRGNNNASLGGHILIEINFNNNWLFEYKNNALEDSIYSKEVSLPHDFSFENDRDECSNMKSLGGYFKGGAGVYKKKLVPRPEMENKDLYICIDRAFSDCEVYINGSFVKRHHYGYTRFTVNITKYIKYNEENDVELIVINSSLPNADYYTGSGILGGVKLFVSEKLHIGLGGVSVSATHLNRSRAAVDIAVNVVNGYSDRKAYGMIIAEIEGRDGRRISTGKNITLEPSEVYTFEAQISIENPVLWNINVPQLYTLTSKIIISGKVIDKTETRFGIRKAEIVDNAGFFLNLRPMKLKGCCIHHDNGVIGAITLKGAEERKVSMLKGLGYNAVRCVCAPAAESFLDACDRLGMLVVYELFDGWRLGRMPYGYFNYFDNEFKQTIKEAVNMAKTHPSVIMWSLGHGIMESSTDLCAIELLDEIRQYIYSLDRTRPITADIRPEYLKESRAAGRSLAGKLDAAGYSYIYNYNNDGVGDDKENKCKELYEKNSGAMCVMASYPLDMAEIWSHIGAAPYIIGDFSYTGIDFLGASGLGRTIYLNKDDDKKNNKYEKFPAHISNCGDLDICGFLKPQGAYRKIMWEMEDKPYIYVRRPDKYKAPYSITAWGWEDITDSWSFSGCEGKMTQIYIYANADEAELFINNKSKGIKKIGEKRAFEAVFEAEYESGRIEAAAYKNGVKMGKSHLQTANEPERIKLSCDKRIVRISTDELVYIKCELLDENGVRASFAKNRLDIDISEHGRLLGAANGDYMYENNYLSSHVTAYNGQALIAVRAVKKGELLVAVKSDGLIEDKLCIELA